jgi:oxalate---CoA ligase
MIFRTIQSIAETRPSTAAILAPGRQVLDYQGLCRQICSAGSVLNENGIGRGDRVVLLVANGPEAASLLLAVSTYATAVPVDPQANLAELRTCLRGLKIRALIADPAHETLAEALAVEMSATRLMFKVDVDLPAGRFFLAGLSTNSPGSRMGPCEPGDDAILLFTSGTTGRPKVVPLTHLNILATAQRTVEMMALVPEDRGLCLAPFFHRQGTITGLTVPLLAGGSVIYPPAFESEVFFEWFRKLKPTWFLANPTVHKAILERAGTHPEALAEHRLRFIRSGASALPPALMQSLESTFNAPVIEAYGMSEAGISCNPLPPALRKPGKVGLPISDVAILGADGSKLEIGEIGEIAVRGPAVTRGYENDPEETAARFRDGWFLTGDEGYFDADGYLEVTGRRKEMINRGGRKVDPRPLEEFLCKCLDVSDAVVFPVPHPSLGEDVMAAVVLNPGSSTTTQRLREEMFHHWATHKVPSRIIAVDALPASPTGKRERLHLVEQMADSIRIPFVEPESTLEIELAKTFSELLHVEKVGRHDNFFALGGDSLKFVELMISLETKLQRFVSDDIGMIDLTPAALGNFLTTPTVVEGDSIDFPETTLVNQYSSGKRLNLLRNAWNRFTDAFRCRRAMVEGNPEEFANFHLIGGNTKGQRTPLFWCCYDWNGFATLSDAIGSDQPIYAIRSGFPPNRSDAWRKALGERFARKIAEIQPKGPLVLGGNCAGAYVAWEAAQVLLDMGRTIDTLFLMDAIILRPSPAQVVLLYGKESLAYNPFLAGKDLRPEWRRFYGSHVVVEVPGKHWDVLSPGTLPVLVEALRTLPSVHRAHA